MVRIQARIEWCRLSRVLRPLADGGWIAPGATHDPIVEEVLFNVEDLAATYPIGTILERDGDEVSRRRMRIEDVVLDREWLSKFDDQKD